MIEYNGNKEFRVKEKGDFMKRWKHVLVSCIAFILPICSILLVGFLQGFAPFGEKIVLVSDLANQYIHFYYYFYDAFYNGESLFYSFEASLGMNFFGIYGYYLASIFSFIVLLFPRDLLVQGVTLLIILKIATAAVTMFYFLRAFSEGKNFLPLIGAILYSLMSYTTTYFFNIMWLDAIVYLPLIVLGVEKMINKKSLLFFIIPLALLFISNFYISFMVGLFIFFYFVGRLILKSKTFKENINLIGTFIGSTVMSVGISAVVLLPTIYSLGQTTNEPVSLKDEMQFNLSEFIRSLTVSRKLFFGSYDNFYGMSTGNVYIGTLGLLLSVLYFISARIPIKERFLAAIITTFVFISFIIKPLYMMWHGLDAPNSFPARFSFIFSFILIVLAIRALQNISVVSYQRILISTLSLLVFFISTYSVFDKKIIDLAFFWMTITLIIVYSLALLLINKYPKAKNWIFAFLLIMTFSEVTLHTSHTVEKLSQDYNFSTTSFNRFFESNDKQIMMDEKKPYDRVIVSPTTSLNDPFTQHVPGINHFSSMMNKDLVSMMKHLGYTTFMEKWVRSKNNGTALSESLLRVKYYYSDIPIDKYGFKLIREVDGRYVYKNENLFPFGFVVKDSMEIETENPFVYSNNLTDAIMGEEFELFTDIGRESLDFETENVLIDYTAEYLTVNKKDNANPGDFTISIGTENPNNSYYLYIPFGTSNATKIDINGRPMGTFPQFEQDYVFNAGLVAQMNINLLANRTQWKKPEFYTMNNQKLKEVVNEVNKNPFQVESFDNTKITGHILNLEEKADFAFLIPYDKGWKVKIDGKEMGIHPVFGGFSGVVVPEGNSELVFTYRPPFFHTGFIITIISLLFLGVLIIRKHFINPENI